MTRHSTILATAMTAAPLFTNATPRVTMVVDPTAAAVTAGHSGTARVDVQTPFHILIEDMLRRSPWLRRGWRRLLGQHQLALRIEQLPSALDQHASVMSETYADGDVVFTTLYVSDGRGLATALGAEVYRLVACLEAIAASPRRGWVAAASSATARAPLPDRVRR